jgi:hypothetical protein
VRLYRVVQSIPPTLDDFESDRKRGRPTPVDPTMRPLVDGFSAFNSEARARSKAQTYLGPGSYIAELEIPEGSAIRFRRTTRARGHYTVWGKPAEITQRVVGVVDA